MSDSKIRYTHVRDIGIGENSTNPEEAALEQIEVKSPQPAPQTVPQTMPQQMPQTAPQPAPQTMPRNTPQTAPQTMPPQTSAKPTVKRNLKSAAKKSQPNSELETLELPDEQPRLLVTKNADDEPRLLVTKNEEDEEEEIKKKCIPYARAGSGQRCEQLAAQLVAVWAF
jgi:hypothetical protein